MTVQKTMAEASQMKQTTERQTLIIYFVVLISLLFFCLGKCLVVPLIEKDIPEKYRKNRKQPKKNRDHKERETKDNRDL